MGISRFTVINPIVQYLGKRIHRETLTLTAERAKLQQPRCRMRHRGCDCQVISCLATPGVHAPTGVHFAYEALERCTMTQP